MNNFIKNILKVVAYIMMSLITPVLIVMATAVVFSVAGFLGGHSAIETYASTFNHPFTWVFAFVAAFVAIGLYLSEVEASEL